MLVTYTRKLLLIIVDFILMNIAIITALLLRFDFHIPLQYENAYLNTFVFITLIQLIIYYIVGMYTSLWRNASIEELMKLFIATVAGTGVSYFFGIMVSNRLPRTVYAISWLLTFTLIGGFRLSFRIGRRIKNFNTASMAANRKRVMIIGAGDAGSMVIREIKDKCAAQYEAVAVIDDDRWKHNFKVHGVPVKGGRDQIIEIAAKENVDEIIVSMPAAGKKTISEILNICKQTRCKLKTLPGVYEMLDKQVTFDKIRAVSIDDLLGREEIKLNTDEIAGYLKDETVLVTGGGGSIGSELCRQIAKFSPRKLIIFDIYENNAYDLQNELINTYKNELDLEVLIGSVRDRKRLKEVFAKYKPGVVFHAAAHKHVPLMEANPAEAIKNNVFGTLNVARAADEYKAKRFVLISTDKAVNPTNVMGATKRVAELIIQAIDKRSKTEFVAVRFGNVLGSNGSVIPLFKKQIASGGPVTVTHPEITRFFMTIPEAASLVIQAGAMAKGGEIFILDMGQPVKIVDLARDLIRLSGYEPDVDIKVVFTGLRPGEKLYEELLLAEEGLQATKHEKIFIGKPLEISLNVLMEKLKNLEQSLDDAESIRLAVANLVPTYNYEVNEVAATSETGAESGEGNPVSTGIPIEVA